MRGTSLDVVAAWKDVLLAAALARRAPRRAHPPGRDVGRPARAPLRGDRPPLLAAPPGLARRRGDAARPALRGSPPPDPGRGVLPRPAARADAGRAGGGSRCCSSASRSALALWGLADVYLVSLQWWRDSGVPGWFEEQLGLVYKGLSGLPENWVFNTGDEDNPIRRLVSTFLSPLATAYVLVIVLLYLVARRRTWWTVTAAVVAYAGLLWTHTRAAYLALALGLAVLALAQRRSFPVVLAAASIVVGRRVREGLPAHRPVDELHAGGARLPPRAGSAAPRCQRRPAQRRRRLHREPPPQPPRRPPRRRPPPAGIRARQRRRQRLADGGQGEGGRVDVHGDRRRHGHPRPARLLRLARRRARPRSGAAPPGSAPPGSRCSRSACRRT